jgi:hypothetical protein
MIKEKYIMSLTTSNLACPSWPLVPIPHEYNTEKPKSLSESFTASIYYHFIPVGTLFAVDNCLV